MEEFGTVGVAEVVFERRLEGPRDSPVLKSVPLTTAPEIYLVEGKAAPGQLAIFGSEPDESTYSPVWKETILTWKASASPVLITSDTQVDKLKKKGMLTERDTTIRLNCPIIRVG